MKKGSKELDVDHIGGEPPITKEEEKLISDFIKSRKGKVVGNNRRGQHGLAKSRVTIKHKSS